MSVKQQNPSGKEQPPPVKLVKLEKAFKLAMQWVNNMSGSWEEEQEEVELKARPSKVGLGAEIPQRSESRLHNDHNNEMTEWKLRAILNPRRKKASEEREEPTTDAKNGSEEEEDGEEESRCKSFNKRRVAPLHSASSVQVNSKKKRRMQTVV